MNDGMLLQKAKTPCQITDKMPEIVLVEPLFVSDLVGDLAIKGIGKIIKDTINFE